MAQAPDREPSTAPEAPSALAVYGTLAPGESNHWVVSRLRGEWATGIVRGYTFDLGWGPAAGYPGFIPDEDGHRVPVAVLESPDLPGRWREIDDFEGPGYERRLIEVELDDGRRVTAQIYVALTDIE